jgi:hypothetical protein
MKFVRKCKRMSYKFVFQDCYQIVLRTLVLVLEKLERVLQMEVGLL